MELIGDILGNKLFRITDTEGHIVKHILDTGKDTYHLIYSDVTGEWEFGPDAPDSIASLQPQISDLIAQVDF